MRNDHKKEGLPVVLCFAALIKVLKECSKPKVYNKTLCGALVMTVNSLDISRISIFSWINTIHDVFKIEYIVQIHGSSDTPFILCFRFDPPTKSALAVFDVIEILAVTAVQESNAVSMARSIILFF